MPTFGKPAIASWGPDRLDVFVRSPTGRLIHACIQGGSETVMDLGGDLDGDPTTIARGKGVLDVFARGTDQRLLRWSWNAALGRMVENEPLPGLIVSDPVAKEDFVFAGSLDGPLRVWEAEGEGPDEVWTFPKSLDPGVGMRGFAFARLNGKLAILFNDGGLTVRTFENGVWDDALRFAGSILSVPVAVESLDGHGFPRLDVLALANDRTLLHWGKSSLFSSSTPSGWFEAEKPPGLPEPFPFDPVGLSTGEDNNLFARDAGGALRHWEWDSASRTWLAPLALGSGLASDPVAIARAPGRIDVAAAGTDQTLLLWSQADGVWASRRWLLAPVVPEAPEDPIAGAADDIAPDFLITRSADHVLLGVHAPGYRLVDGQPPKLVPDEADAHVVLTLPPQHIAEEVAGPGQDGANVRRAVLSGPSRVAFSVRSEAGIELTGEGVLAALDGAAVDANEDRTAIELPYGLILSPEGSPSAGGPAVSRHPSRPVEAAGTVGLWRARLGNTLGDGGLAVKGTRGGRPDPFPVALTKASRLLIAAQPTPARADRLELSVLGGSLTASGRWGALDWDHEAVLGRDQKVRTVTRGMLYPFGHRAVFEEVTERVLDEPVATLRKTRTLYVTEPRRNLETASAQLRHAFPFREAELTRLEFGRLDDPRWHGIPDPERPDIPLPTEEIGFLERFRDDDLRQFDESHEALFGDMGFHEGLVTEDLAVLGESEEIRTLAANALQAYASADRIDKRIEALERDGQDKTPVDLFFMPEANGEKILFPMRCRGSERETAFSLPLLFVVDFQRGFPSYQSLTDPRLADWLADVYADHGVVELSGMALNLTPGDGASAFPSDVQEVHRLNIGGRHDGNGFRPALGRPEAPWAAEIALPAMRSLLERDPRVQIGYTKDYLISGAADIATHVLGEVVEDGLKTLDVDFTGIADRSGGLVVPNFSADGISRARGLVNVIGAQTLDPKAMFAQGASLFGLDLRDLLGNISEAPEVATVLNIGAPPTVRMTWNDVPLTSAPASEPIFIARPEDGPEGSPLSRLTLNVLSAPNLNESTCTIRNFTLAMPPGDSRLVEVDFESVRFHQKTGQPPTLALGKITARFVGKLQLLQQLQDRVGLPDSVPRIELRSNEIVARFAVPVPDVSAFSFVMSNLTFTAVLRVPFNGDPVSLAIGFASREKPFTLTVLMFGGGGYIDIEFQSGLRRLEISLQFGAAIALNFGIGVAEVHAFGGIRYQLLAGGAVELTGFIRIGGSIDILGLISVSVELRVELRYQFETSRLVGRAKLVIEIDLTLYSDRVELDSGEWAIIGGSAPPPPPPSPAPPMPLMPVQPLTMLDVAFPGPMEAKGLDDWQAYRRMFV